MQLVVVDAGLLCFTRALTMRTVCTTHMASDSRDAGGLANGACDVWSWFIIRFSLSNREANWKRESPRVEKIVIPITHKLTPLSTCFFRQHRELLYYQAINNLFTYTKEVRCVKPGKNCVQYAHYILSPDRRNGNTYIRFLYPDPII